MPSTTRPIIIGITADVNKEGKYAVSREYVEAVLAAGGLPVVLPPPHLPPHLPPQWPPHLSPHSSSDGAAASDELAERYVALCDGIVLSGGDDPIMSQWGEATHPKARPVSPARQAFELAILRALDVHAGKPALGICLGMQYMGLHHGGKLDQHLPDTLATAGEHCDGEKHAIEGELGRGVVRSFHRQALREAGSLRVIARSADGVIEAVKRDDRPFYVGVQWHPERTDDAELGVGIIRRLVEAAREAKLNPQISQISQIE